MALGIWVMGLTLAFAAGYIWWSWKPDKGQPTPDVPLFEEKDHKEINSPSRPESLAGRSYSDFKGLPMVAIVIDDLGYQKQLSVDFIEVDVPLTLSFLPQAPFAGEMVRLALQRGKESLLHLPMEPKDFPQTNPGPKALLTSMSDEEIREILGKDLEAFPQMAGVNNHMGSRFTEDRHKMALVLRTIKERKLYFFDSRTTPQSVILPLASRMGVKSIQRDIFLDNIVEEEAIRGQLDLLIRLAQERGFAVACGHPFPQTLQAIKEKFPDLQDKVRVVPLSKLL